MEVNADALGVLTGVASAVEVGAHSGLAQVGQVMSAAAADMIQCASVTVSSAEWIISSLFYTGAHLNALKGFNLSEAQQLSVSHLCSFPLLHAPAVEVIPYITPFHRGFGLTDAQRYRITTARTPSESPSNFSLRLRGGADDMSRLLNRILVAAVKLIGEPECSY